MSTIHRAAASLEGQGTLTVSARVERNLAMSPEANELLSGLAQENHMSEGDILRLALSLFKVAVEARKEGKHVGVADSPDALDLELVGF